MQEVRERDKYFISFSSMMEWESTTKSKAKKAEERESITTKTIRGTRVGSMGFAVYLFI